jgi:3-oxoadipate enol-lactonase
MPFIDASGGRIHYRMEGPSQAAMLVLSNSLGTNLALWGQQMAAFSRHFRVLRYDSRGHGESSITAGPHTIELLARDVLALLDHLEVNRGHFCGLSLGGMVGMWLAAHAPDRIGKLVLANTAAYMGPAESWNARIDAVCRGGLGAIVESVIQRWFTPLFRERSSDDVERVRKMMLATPVDGYVACCTAIRDMDQRADLGTISSPTLVIGGRHDLATPPAGSRDMVEAIRGAAYLELAAAHLSNVEAADAFNSVVLDFLLSSRSCD